MKTCFKCKYFSNCGDVERVEKCNGYELKNDGILYDPEFNNGGYNLPIYDNDGMLNGFTFRDFIDVYTANNGRNGATPAKLKKEFNDFLKMRINDANENFDLCIDGILKEIERN